MIEVLLAIGRVFAILLGVILVFILFFYIILVGEFLIAAIEERKARSNMCNQIGEFFNNMNSYERQANIRPVKKEGVLHGKGEHKPDQ